MLKSPFLFYFFFLSMLVACNNSDQHMPLLDIHGMNQQGQGNVTGIGPFFLSDVLPVLNNNCLPCHGQGSALDWTNYNTLRSKKTQIEQRVLGPQANMPIKKALSDESKLIIQKWLDAGMPFTQDSTPVPPPIPPKPIPQTYTYENDVLPIIRLYCILCHNENSGGRIRNWLNYDIAFEYRDAMRFKMVEKSMPLRGANIQMPDEARDIIILWIDQGAQRGP